MTKTVVVMTKFNHDYNSTDLVSPSLPAARCLHFCYLVEPREHGLVEFAVAANLNTGWWALAAAKRGWCVTVSIKISELGIG
jgi:hypothetical protein